MTATEVEAAPSIHVLISRVLADLPAIGKDSYNEQQKFKFRGIDDVMNALNPLLSFHGVFFVPHVLERIESERATRNGSAMYVVNLHVQYRFYGPNGDFIEASGWGEGTDMGDKATNKAMTGAMKYVLFQVFAISTQEAAENDSDRGGVEETSGGRRAQAAPLAEQVVPPSVADRLAARMNALPDSVRAKCKAEFVAQFGKPAELRRGDMEAADALVASHEPGGGAASDATDAPPTGTLSTNTGGEQQTDGGARTGEPERDTDSASQPAAGEPAATPPPPNPDPMLPSAQRKLFATIKDRGIADRHEWAAGVLGRPIGSFSDLTAADGRQLLDVLARMPVSA